MYTSYERNTRNQKTELPWTWILTVVWIIILLFLIKIFSGGQSEQTASFLTVSPGEQSTVYISMSSSSKNRISTNEKLYATDKAVSVENGYAKAINDSVKVDIDANSELSYKDHSATGNTLSTSKGRLWIETLSEKSTVVLKNFSVLLSPGSIAIVEQNWPFSAAYAIKGEVKIETKVGTVTLPVWSGIKLLASDLISQNAALDSWIAPIDGSIAGLTLFTRNNGKELLGNVATWTGRSLTGGTSSTGWVVSGGKFIEITEPKINTTIKSSPITLMGNLLSKEVKRVTINNKDAVVSPVEETFVYQGLDVSGDIIDIVYKAYDASNTLLESWVYTLYGSKSIAKSSELIPETFPLSSKDFVITSPAQNPYKTTETFVKVQGTLPKNSVEYIMVNDYRLQKFIPNSSSWYYFANMANNTMEDGINMYTIKFYNKEGKIVSTQVFTLIKESKNATVSGEASR